MPTKYKSHFDHPYKLTDNAIYYFRESGFIKLKDVLSPNLLAYYSKEITRIVFELNTMQLPMEERDTYHKAFLQKPANENQEIDWDVWCPGVKVGDIISTELNPVVYSKS